MNNLENIGPEICWFGPTYAVMEHLEMVGADRDDNNRFIITGAEVTVGMGGDELIIPRATNYMLEGKEVPLADSLSAGLGVRVARI